ncbi:putative Ig domain-containing protein [Pedobacter helvus]|uniref:Ig domain-containing protein n=1 Tax=Pedobacter helvus TaxID=2563444 RepID=A0ABW9JF09_9SPHI|nr:putative Ig domain-containing protein [Pedobacter ureilyticus]
MLKRYKIGLSPLNLSISNSKLNFTRLLFRMVLVLCVATPFWVTAQQKPNVTYGQSSYLFTKGISVSGFQSPTNSGGAVPAKIRGGVEESIGLGEYNASKISKTGDGNLISLLLGTDKIQEVNLTSKTITRTRDKRDKPWAVVKDSKGNVYWTETGSYKIIANPDAQDAISYASQGLAIGGAIMPGKLGSALSFYNNVSDLYSAFTGGGDLLRDVSGVEEPPKYILEFSGRIYKLAPGATEPTVFLDKVQVPTGLAIDQNDNLFVACFTANFTVKGGISFSGGSIEKVDDENGSYNAKIIKVTPTAQVSDVGTWTGIDYPNQIGIDAQGNLTVMYNYGNNMEDIGFARIRKYPVGQSTGDTYKTATFLFQSGTRVDQNRPVYQDLAVDAAGNVYLSDFYADKIWMLPVEGTSANDLQVFSQNALSPVALYIDATNNQLWVKEGKFVSTGAIKKLSLYGYSVSPSLPTGLALNTNGTISGTASTVSANKQYTVVASNAAGYAKTNINIEVKQIAAPQLSYATSTYNLPVSQAANIPTPNNSGGSFNQQIGPLTVADVYKGGTKMQGFAFDGNGNKFFVQPDSSRIIKIDAAGKASVFLSNINKPSDIAIDRNNGTFYFSQINGNDVSLSAMYAGFDRPTDLTKGSVAGLAIDASGNVYTALQGNGDIYKFTPATAQYLKIVTGLNQPKSIAISGDNLYILNIYGLLQKTSLSNPGTPTTVATVTNGYEVDADDYGNVYVAAATYVYKIAPGSTTPEAQHLNGWYFSGLGVDRDNNLYVAPVQSGSAEFKAVKITSGGFTISPALPTGLTFNANGTITGTPTSITASKAYTVSASNPLGNSSTTVNIAVVNVATTGLQYTFPTVLNKGVPMAAVTPTVTGGKPDSFSISPALPAGLSMNTTTGVISGTPSVNENSATYTITANNTAGNKTATITFSVKELPPSSLQYAFASTTLNRDIAVSVTPTVIAGAGVSYSVSPALPTGLTLNTSTGAISGTPTVITAAKTYTITATNNGGSTQLNLNLSVKLDPPSNLVYTFDGNLLRDVVFTAVTPTYNGSGVTGFTVNPALPAGLTLNPTTGVISGTPTAITTSTNYTVTATNDAGTTNRTFAISVRVDPPVNLKYDFAHTNILRNTTIPLVTPTYSGSKVATFTINPALPTGLSINASTGVISGTPTVLSSSTTYTVTATNDGGSTTVSFSLLVTELAPANLQYAFISSSLLRGLEVSPVRPSYSGGTATLFTVSPSLPSGLTLNSSTGVISGTPNAITANASYTVTASNTAGSTTFSFPLLVKVDPPTNLRYDFRDTDLQKDVLLPNYPPKYSGSPATSFSVSPSLPAGLSFSTTTGLITGTPTALSSVTTYTVTANNDGGSTSISFPLSVSRIPIPEITYANDTYKFTKGTPITTIAAPNNTGVVFPQQRIGEAIYTGLVSPTGVATDPFGNTYIADFEGGNIKIKRLDKGASQMVDFVTSGVGTTAAYDLAADVSGNIYVSVGTVIKKITPSKVVSDFATGLNNITGLFIDANNDLYAAEYSLGQVIKYTDCNVATKSIKVTGLNVGATLTTPAEYPRDIVVDRQKNIYVLQASLLSDNRVAFMFLYKYFASDDYVKVTRSRVITSVDYSSYMIIDSRDNLYIGTDANSIIVLDNYVDRGKRLVSQLTTGKTRGLSLDADQNAFYALSATSSALGKASQFGYNTNNLPAGLSLNANGTVTGTPTNVQSQGNFLITASSFYGVSTDTLKIAVVDTIPSFNYAQPNQVLTAGVSNLNMVPIRTGGPVTSYSVSPTQLPLGITFTPSTGAFTGTPTKLQDAISTYVVSATNTGGTGKDTVTFKVVDREPTNLVYPSSYVAIINQQFKGSSGTASGGAVTKWSISPALPDGLFIDTLSGIIQGYPIVTRAAANYTVKAENSGGFTTAIVNVEVRDLPPNISYAIQNNFKFKKGDAITPIAPPDNAGGPIVSYSISGLPTGLTLNANGSITGTPTQLKQSTEYRVIADGGQWGRDTTTLNIEVVSLPPNSIAYNTPVTIIKGSPIPNITPTYTSTGGDPVERFTITPELPAGLSINPTTGVISGQPTEILNTNGQLYYITAENGAGSKNATLVFILKDLAPAISYNNDNIFTKGTAANLNVNSTGGAVTKYKISPALPQGLALDTVSGVISGNPSALNVKTQYTITASNYGNPDATSSFYITVIDTPPAISYTTPQNLTRTVAISPISVTSTGGQVVQYTVSPALPAGLSLNATTGEISGTPTTSAVAKNYTITATNTGGSANAVVNISVTNAKPIIEYNSANVLIKNAPVANFEPSSTGGNQATFTISPALPAGLSLDDQTGAITGTPTDTTTLKSYTVTAINDGGQDEVTFSIKVNDKPPGNITYAELTDDFYVGYAITPLTPQVEAGGGAIARYAISPTNLAPGLSFNTTTGVLSGTPTSDYVRTTYTISAHNSGGTSQTTITFAVIKLSATLSKTDVKCNGSQTGTATATVVGGKAPYRYAWSPRGGSAATAEGLSAGTYTVTITDANNTVITRTVLIEEPSALVITNLTKVDNQAFGASNGSATATVTGGVAPYTYAWTGNASTSATAANLAEGTYTLTVTDANNCSVVKEVFIDAPPAAPTNLAAQAGNTRNTLTWAANTETDLASYKVYGGTTANPTTLLQVLTAPIATYTHQNLTNGTTYYYRITAVDKAGFESAYSVSAMATPQGEQNITFTPLAAKTYGDTDFSAGATASSGLTVSYTSDNLDVATIVAGKVHIVGAGTANITASQSGNTAWLPAASQVQQLTVNKRNLTLTATAKDKVYDGERTAEVTLADNRLAGDELTITYATSLFNNKNVGVGKNVTVSGINITGTHADRYAYSTTVATTADIAPKTLTVTATANNKVYDGNANAEVTLTDNRLNGDVFETAFTTASFNNKNVGTAKAVSVKGISIAGTDAGNYTTGTTVSTTANITPKALTISASGINKVYDGNANAAVTLTDNRVTGDVLTTQYTTAAFDNKNVGTAKTVTVNGLSISGVDAANYAINTNATTTANVTARALMVTAAGINKTYDGSFTATVNLTDNRVTGDELTAAYSFAIFDDKNVGVNKSVAVFGISISGTDAANYSVNATANTAATIARKTLTITAENKTKIQGLPMPAFTVTYDGFVNGENNSILNTQVSLTTAATNISPEGTYPIVAANTLAQNYEIVHVNGLLTVLPGTPTDIALSQALFLENSATGTSVGTLGSTAPDPNAIFTYTLVVGNGAADNSKFVIEGNLIRSATVLDYETQNSFNIRVRTTTQYGSSFEKELTITLTDVNEIPTLADIADQTICYTTSQQTVNLTGISTGPETSQTARVTVTSDNSALFSSLTAGNVNGTSAQLNYRVASGKSGVANVTVTITDNGGTANGGVNTITKVFVVTVNPLPQIAITSDLGTSFSKGQTATLVATGGVSYQWSGPMGMIGDRNTNTLKVRPEQASSTYTVTVTSEYGCTSTESITLSVQEDIQQIAGTNIITPNGDGVNDNLIIKNVDLYQDNQLDVYDRAGRKIYSKARYQNEWDGRLNGLPLAEGTYYYIIEFKNVGKYKGFITIIKD